MNSKEKFEYILKWYSSKSNEDVKEIDAQNEIDLIEKVKDLIDEQIPADILELYKNYNGEKGNGFGSFLGNSFISLSEIINSLEFSKTLIKSESPSITNPTKSESIIKSIIEVYKTHIPQKKMLGFIKTKWYKLEFNCSPNSMGGPYFYKTKETTGKEREILKLTDKSRKKISSLTKELHNLELKDYNWDNIEVVVYGSGEYNVNRTFYNFDEELPLTSHPANAIKKKYFHIKWLPILSDFGGNYIGLDLDPDKKGVKGQVIVFGRDEEDMFVIANSWSEFLDFTIEQIDQNGNKFISESHLHEVYKKLKSA